LVLLGYVLGDGADAVRLSDRQSAVLQLDEAFREIRLPSQPETLTKMT
jgi:hypothetical protein